MPPQRAPLRGPTPEQALPCSCPQAIPLSSRLRPAHTPPARRREIPPLPWYRQTVPQMVMAGFLPFSAIYIELYYIFASVWGHKVGGRGGTLRPLGPLRAAP